MTARERYPYMADRAISYGGVIGTELTQALNEIDALTADLEKWKRAGARILVAVEEAR